MIIDCHCHAGKGDGLTGPWDTAAPIENYLRRAAKAGVTHTVFFAAFHSDYASLTVRSRASWPAGQIVSTALPLSIRNETEGASRP